MHCVGNWHSGFEMPVDAVDENNGRFALLKPVELLDKLANHVVI